MRRLRVLAMLLVVIPGCISIGRDFPTEPVASLRPGVTTQVDARRLFGEPWRTGRENSHRTWTYGRYRYALLGEGLARDLVLRFDENGVLASFTFNTTERRPADSR